MQLCGLTLHLRANISYWYCHCWHGCFVWFLRRLWSWASCCCCFVFFNQWELQLDTRCGVAWITTCFKCFNSRRTAQQNSCFFITQISVNLPFNACYIWQDSNRWVSLLCLVLELSLLCVPCSAVPVPGVTQHSRALSESSAFARNSLMDINGY